IVSSGDENLALNEMAQALAGKSGSQAMEIVNARLRRLIPFSLCVIYSYEVDRDELEARYTAGKGASFVKGSRIELGQRLSGWVAANRQAILNSDAALDFCEVARSFCLQSSLSVPLESRAQLIGVLSLYSTAMRAFTNDHRRVLEAAARYLSRAM